MRMKKSVKIFVALALMFTLMSTLNTPGASAAQFFIKPSAGSYTSPFGYRASTGTYHYGIDIATGGTVAVNASAAGTVRVAANGCADVGFYGSTCNSGWGNYIIVTHSAANGQVFETVYAHLKGALSVSVGQKVSQGQRLGTMGSSGSSTGQHLHFELHKGMRSGSSTAVDPMPYITGQIDPSPVTYHTYDGTWAVVKIVSPTGGSTANLFQHVGYGIIGTLPVGNTYKVYDQAVYSEDETKYYNVGPGYIHHAYGEVNNHHAVVDVAITTYTQPNGTVVNRTVEKGTYRIHAAKDGWYDLGASTWVKADKIKVIKNP